MKRNNHLKLLSYIVMAYMLLAFGWWAVLLHKKNNEAYDTKKELLIHKLKHDNQTIDESFLLTQKDYISLNKKYNRQKYMILGEGLVFIISLFMGMWFIYRGYRRQVETAEEKRNFLLSITHELKSPLASLKIATDTLSKRTLNKEQQKMLTDNNRSDIERLQNLVDNLLLAAKMESNYEPIYDTINLTNECKRTIDQFQSKYPDAEFEFHADESISIQADRIGLISIIYNLIENAIKYSPNEQKVSIHIKQTQDFITLSITDRGMGIPTSERNKIFNRFYRVGSEETRKTKGTGLGLYIVDQIVKVHQWKIHISNNAPQGTIIEIRIPK